MFSRQWIENLDATGRIYRKANEQYLPAFQAFWLLTRDVSLGILLGVFGCLNAGMIVFSGQLLGISGFLWLAVIAFAVLAVLASLLDAYSLVFPYYQFWMRTSHGSARWASLDDLRSHSLLRKIGESVPAGALRIGRVFADYDLILPKELWLLHLVFFGPTGAGKTKTFFMSMLRYLAAHGSCIAFDPKGELYEQTAMDYRIFYRLDLINPAQSDRWNFMPICLGNSFFANLREESAKNFSAGDATASKETSLSGTYVLTAEDAAHEQTESERLKSENENYLSIAQRVL